MSRRLVVLSMLAALLVVGCVSTPSLERSAELVNGTLHPFAAEQAPLVRITDGAAASIVLDTERATGWPDDNVAWLDGGCVLIATFERHPMSRDPNPPAPYPVFLVRLANGPAVTWVMVDARSGDLGAAIGDHPEFGCEPG